MKKIVFGVALLACLGLLGWLGTGFVNRSAAESDAHIETPAKQAQTPLELTGEDALLAAFVIAHASPALPEESKLAIEQDYYGAPLNGPPAIHEISVESLTCVDKFGAANPAYCMGTYAKDDAPIKIDIEEAATLYYLLVEKIYPNDTSWRKPTITLHTLTCTVDDAQVQGSPGGNLMGGMCDFFVSTPTE